MATVLISIGSNVGSRLLNCLKALESLKSPAIQVRKVSPWFLSEPLGLPQPWFINGAALLFTSLSPFTLLTRLQEVERALGRKGKGTGGPRTIDLDLILYGQVVMESPWLTLPHPSFRERRFVLEPLARIAPYLRDPVTGLTMKELLDRCRDSSRVIPLKTGEQPLESGIPHPSAPLQRLPGAFWCRL